MSDLDFRDFIKEELIILDMEAQTAQEALERISALLYDKGYVKDTYAAALWAREQEYPTGLPIETYNIAIPHAPQQHVCKQAIAVVRLKNSVEFASMEDSDVLLPVHLITCLVMCHDDSNIKLFPKLIRFFTNEGNIEALMQLKTTAELYRFIMS